MGALNGAWLTEIWADRTGLSLWFENVRTLGVVRVGIIHLSGLTRAHSRESRFEPDEFPLKPFVRVSSGTWTSTSLTCDCTASTGPGEEIDPHYEFACDRVVASLNIGAGESIRALLDLYPSRADLDRRHFPQRLREISMRALLDGR